MGYRRVCPTGMAARMVSRACPVHAVLGHGVDLQPDRGAATHRFASWIVCAKRDWQGLGWSSTSGTQRSA
jgi:hypothetical protein